MHVPISQTVEFDINRLIMILKLILKKKSNLMTFRGHANVYECFGVLSSACEDGIWQAVVGKYDVRKNDGIKKSYSKSRMEI